MQWIVPATRTTSPLGFGCGSVLGRVGRTASLRAMGVAWDHGITLFDTARSYGFGEAESVLGDFLRGKRDHAVIATKYGLLPQRQSPLKRLALPVVRAAMQVPGVRSALKSGGDSSERVFGEFSPVGLRTSVEESLRQLRTDRLDLLFLHEAPHGIWQDEALMTELASLVQAGKVLRFGLYGGADVIAAGLAAGFGAMQFGANAFDPVVARIESGKAEAFLIENHPFGSPERVARLEDLLDGLAADASVPAPLRDKLGNLDWDVLTEAIFGLALLSADAIVLSMMAPEHLRANVKAVENGRFTVEELSLLRERLLAAPESSDGRL